MKISVVATDYGLRTSNKHWKRIHQVYFALYLARFAIKVHNLWALQLLSNFYHFYRFKNDFYRFFWFLKQKITKSNPLFLKGFWNSEVSRKFSRHYLTMIWVSKMFYKSGGTRRTKNQSRTTSQSKVMNKNKKV